MRVRRVARANETAAGTRRAAWGLTLALGAPAVFTLLVAPRLLAPRLDDATLALVGLAFMWALAAVVVAIGTRGEARPFSSIGWERPTWRAVGGAAALGLVLSLLVPALTLLVHALVEPAGSGIGEAASRYPLWIVAASVVTAAVTEEVLFRGYALSRLLERTGSPWIAGGVSLAFFTLTHAAGWAWTHLVAVVIPMGAALTALYLWRRNVILVIVTHLVIDLPLVFLSL